MSAEMKPCPFCGAGSYLLTSQLGYMVKCLNSECYAQTDDRNERRQSAIEAWNRRTPASEALALLKRCEKTLCIYADGDKYLPEEVRSYLAKHGVETEGPAA